MKLLQDKRINRIIIALTCFFLIGLLSCKSKTHKKLEKGKWDAHGFVVNGTEYLYGNQKYFIIEKIYFNKGKVFLPKEQHCDYTLFSFDNKPHIKFHNCSDTLYNDEYQFSIEETRQNRNSQSFQLKIYNEEKYILAEKTLINIK